MTVVMTRAPRVFRLTVQAGAPPCRRVARVRADILPGGGGAPGRDGVPLAGTGTPAHRKPTGRACGSCANTSFARFPVGVACRPPRGDHLSTRRTGRAAPVPQGDLHPFTLTVDSGGRVGVRRGRP
ncbi:hypothetical protein GCM10008939_37380 [Deinococcus aquiradiocola]|uniref:Uncharacterized protein n=1 Tax=Deinococcus aquiradiocola TaxID=393059 RepID=A0A917PSJ9_9DEIO|nr:hypothetical protein GCM10008939_37380 [Deinococcus aquiradiocola]